MISNLKNSGLSERPWKLPVNEKVRLAQMVGECVFTGVYVAKSLGLTTAWFSQLDLYTTTSFNNWEGFRENVVEDITSIPQEQRGTIKVTSLQETFNYLLRHKEVIDPQVLCEVIYNLKTFEKSDSEELLYDYESIAKSVPKELQEVLRKSEEESEEYFD